MFSNNQYRWDLNTYDEPLRLMAEGEVTALFNQLVERRDGTIICNQCQGVTLWRKEWMNTNHNAGCNLIQKIARAVSREKLILAWNNEFAKDLV